MRSFTAQRSLFLGLFALVGSLSGCHCNTTTIGHAKGDPNFIVTKGDASQTLADEGKSITIDFGPTLVNQDQANQKVLSITNTGVATVSITGLTKSDGFNSDVFKIPASAQVLQQIASGSVGTINLSFSPVVSGDFTSTFTLQTDADDTLSKPLTVTLKGQGVSNGCVFAPADKLDFGNVKTGSSYSRNMVVQNTTPLDWTFTYRGITGSDAALFTSPLAIGPVTIKAHDSLTIPVTYTANHPDRAAAELQFDSPGQMCAPEPFDLRANAVDSLLTATPDPIDFGFVDPSVTWGAAKQTVTLANLGNDPIVLSQNQFCDGDYPDEGAYSDGAACTATSEFANTATGAEADVGNLSIPAGGTATIDLYFKPARLHQATASMQFKTDNPAQVAFGFRLKGQGGGPKIQVTPPTVDYGVVAIGAPQSRSVIITNVGSSISTIDDSKLKITSITITPGTGTQTDEFTVGSFDASDHTKSWLAATQRLSVPVQFNPNGAGAKTATLTVVSNDPVTPEATVTLQADGQQLPPCTYTVTPPTLNFGNVQPGRNRIMTFRVQNTSATNSCLVSALDLTADTTNPPFSLVNGPVPSQTIAGGASLDVQVKFAPTVASQTNYAGAISFYTSSAAAPEFTVTLSGGSSTGCVLITPDDLDFGVVAPGCASRERTFTIYNVCNVSQHVTSIGLLPDASGLCPDQGASHTCPFRITAAPTLPATIAAGSSADFKIKYQPAAVQVDSASVAVQTQELSEPYIVTLAGHGDPGAVQVDTFRQDAQPKVDVLLVIDDSGSMYNNQQAIANNFQSFIQFAVSQQVDYHIGVTTTGTYADYPSNCTDTGVETACGILAPKYGSGTRVLTNTTPNLSALFAQNVAVGTDGDPTEMGFEGAYEALSPSFTIPGVGSPVNTTNAGFLRDEANLAIVVASDASDQSPNTFDFYKNFFLNIKGFRRTNAFSFSAVSSTFSSAPANNFNCSYDGTNEIPNPYGVMAQATNGIFQEICTNDWASSLRQLGQSAFGYKTRFFLSETPDTNFSIDVTIDGVPYPAVDATSGGAQWSYNSTANAIDFQPFAVPEPGSTLKFSYHVLCYPTSP